MNWFIKILFTYIGICCSSEVLAQTVIDSTATKADSTLIIADSTSKPKVKPYHALIIGVDAVKGLYNLLDTNKTRLEFVGEYKWKKSTWLQAEYGLATAKYKGANLQYNSTSTGITLGLSKSFFEGKARKDVDNAFVGVQFGAAINSSRNVSYIINDLWGENVGTFPNRTSLVYWSGLVGGFRFKVTKQLVMGWRAKVKVLINPGTFTDVAPIYIALYGKGDRPALFDYNMYICWHLW